MTTVSLPDSFSLLVLEDDPVLGAAIVDAMEGAGVRASQATSCAEAESLLQRESFDVVLADWLLPDGDPTELIATSLGRDDTLQFVVMSGEQTGAAASAAIKAGAEQFVFKPIDFEALRIILARLAKKAQEARRAALSGGEELDPFGAGVADLDRSQCAKIALQRGNVIISGETGSGKGVMAKWIHAESGRPGPFVGLNCAGLNPELLESELFGHERGAFTGATQRKRGLFELARAGTVFLDELGELPRVSQAKILKVVEEGRFRRLGGTQEIATDARIVGASHRDLSDPSVLRTDLYYRLATFQITIRPLRERPHALEGIAQGIIRSIRPGVKLAPETLAALRDYHWPGNVRELRNVLERSVSLMDGPVLTPGALDLPTARRTQRSEPHPAPTLSLAEVEANYIDRVVRHCSGNLTQAAKILKISRTTLYKKLAALGAENVA